MSSAVKRMTALFFHPLFVRLRQIQFVFAVAIFCYMALMPMTAAPGGWPPALLHFSGNVLLMLSAWAALFPKLKLPTIVILALSVSAAAEFAQMLTNTRTTDPFDLVANGAGVLVGFLLCVLCEKFLLDHNY